MTPQHHDAGEALFSVFDAHGRGSFGARELQAVAQRLNEPLRTQDAADAIFAASGEDELDYDTFMEVWSSVPDGLTDGFPAPDKVELHHQRAIKLLLSRLLHVSARCGSAALCSTLPVHSGTFPSLHWRMHLAAPRNKRVDHTLQDCTLSSCWQEVGALAPVPVQKRASLSSSWLPPPQDAAPTAASTGSSGMGVDWNNDAGVEEASRSAMGRAQELLLRGAGDDTVALQEGLRAPSSLQAATAPLWTHRQMYHADGPQDSPLPLSPWHDIPVVNTDGTLNMVVEIPKWSRTKVECATREPFNPLKLDSKNGAVRTYSHGDMLFNYGFLPQTWEDPEHVHPDTGAGGDNDPLDVVELGMRAWPVGTVLRVKPLGIMAMIDGGETDWKLLTVAVSDPIAPMLSNLDDLHIQLPGAVAATHRWFRLYKWPEMNSFAFSGQAQDRQYAERIIAETHVAWRKLVDKE